jgi:hypothetical protein
MNSSATVRALRAATLAISAGTPATVNGLLDKTAGIGESGISNATGSFASGGVREYPVAVVLASLRMTVGSKIKTALHREVRVRRTVRLHIHQCLLSATCSRSCLTGET